MFGMDPNELLDNALACHRTGQWSEAEALYRQLLSQLPNHVVIRTKLGIVLQQQNRLEEAAAEYQAVLKTAPDNTTVLCNLGLTLRGLGRLDAALEHLSRAVQIDPANADSHNNLGTVLQDLGRYPDALQSYQNAVASNGEHTTFQSNLGLVLMKLDRLDEAEEVFRAVLRLDPDHLVARESLATVLRQLHRPDESITVYQSIAERFPDRLDVKARLAHLYEMTQQRIEAREIAEQVVLADPRHVLGNVVLARLERQSRQFDDAEARLQAVVNSSNDSENSAHLADAWFELGQTLDRMGRYDDAFGAFRSGNRCAQPSAGQIAIRPEVVQSMVRRLREWVTTERVAGWPADPPDDGQPAHCLFVGFPRSGTTLAEQMLSCHPALVTSDELPLLQPLMANLPERFGHRVTYPECIEELEEEAILELREHYWTNVRKYLGETNRDQVVIDKLPLNLIQLALVRRLFPEARILVALRDPRDVCLSCFTHFFEANQAMAYFNDLESTAEFYQSVMDLWLHYRTTLELNYLEYRYEDLIEDPESTLRRILQFLGVTWDERVLSYFERNPGKYISTPSYHDVTQPIYRRSKGRFHNYRAQLSPILPILRPYIDTYGYQDD
jgi:tetratricopeptide (TPR) repeat protein